MGCPPEQTPEGSSAASALEQHPWQLHPIGEVARRLAGAGGGCLTHRSGPAGSLPAPFPFISWRLAAPAHGRILSVPGGLQVTGWSLHSAAAYLRWSRDTRLSIRLRGRFSREEMLRTAGQPDGRTAVYTARPWP